MKKRLKVKWGNVAILMGAIWCIASFIGISVSEPITKENGNVCRGYEWGMQICSGDINKEEL